MRNVKLILILTFIAKINFAQTFQVRVLDKDTKQPVVYANVLFTDFTTSKSKLCVTALNGAVANLIKHKSLVSISFIGYKTLIDTVFPNENKTYFLEPDVFNMEQVVVTSSLTNKTLKNAPVITQIITAQQIKSRGLKTVQDVLEADIPGIEFNRHGASQDISVQGLDAKNVLVLIDGERLAGETRGNVDYSRLNTNDIQRIEVVKGASSALYGSQAMGAVVNIITKNSKQKLFASISSKYTGYNQVNFPKLSSSDDDFDYKRNLDYPNLNVGSVFGFNFRKFSSKTSLVVKSTDGYQLFNKDSVTKVYVNIDTVIHEPLQNTPTGIEGTSDYSIDQKFGYLISKNIKISANGGYYLHHKYDFNRDNKHDLYEDYSYGMKLKYHSGSKFSTILSYHFDNYNKYDFLEKLDTRKLNYRNKFINPKLVCNYNVNENNNLVAGLELFHESLLSDMFTYNKNIQKDESNYVLFFQDDVTLKSKFNFIVGLRGEYYDTYGVHFSPKVSLMYKVLPFTFRLNYATGYRSPSLKELYMDWNHLNMFTIKGDENLKPESNNYISGSIEILKSWLNASVIVYDNYFNNKIEGTWNTNQTVYQYANMKKQNLVGINFLMKIQPIKHIVIKSAYSYVNINDYQLGVNLSSASPHTANLQFEYKVIKNQYLLTLNLTGKYIGAKDFDVSDEIVYKGKNVTAYYPVHYNAYSMWKFSISQQFLKSVNLLVGIDNLFDYKANIITFNTSITPGRRYFISLDFDIAQFYNYLHNN